MTEQPTCGKGLAEHSAVPSKLAEFIATMAENLEVHMKALDLKDVNARKEHDAYAGLAAEYREIARALKTTAGRMAGYRTLPMGRHDPDAMSSPQVVEVFEKFVQREEELKALLQRRVEQDRGMLAGMGQATGGETK